MAPHRHEVTDENILVHRGSGTVELGAPCVAFTSDATFYISKHVRIAVQNIESEPASIAFVFSGPSFEAYLRDTSVPEGQAVVPLSTKKRCAIRERHRWHTIFERP